MPPGPTSPLTIVLTAAERSDLEGVLRRTTVAAGLARRARIVLLLTDGHTISETARRVGVQPRIVRQWGVRFRDERLPGLTDRPRPGRPPGFPPLGGGPYGRPGLHPAR